MEESIALKVKQKKTKWPVFIALFFVIIAILIFISGINKPFLSPFSKTVEFKKPTAVGYSEDYRSVIDSQGHRMLIMNNEDELISIVDTTKSGSPVDILTGTFVDGDTVYATGYTQVEEGITIDSEKVLAYDIKGKVKDTLYTYKYDDGDRVTTPSYNTLIVEKGKLYITACVDKKVTLFSLDPKTKKAENIWQGKSSETIYSSSFVPELNRIYIQGRSTKCYYCSLEGESFEEISYKRILNQITDIPGNAKLTEYNKIFKDIYCFPVIISTLEGQSLCYVFVNRSSGEVKIISQTGEEYNSPSQATYGTLFFVKNLAHWISCGILALLLLLLLIWIVVKKLTRKKRMGLLMLCVLMFIAGFYSYNDQKRTEEHIGNSMIAECSQMSQLITASAGDSYRMIEDYGLQKFCSDPSNIKLMDSHQNLIRNLAEVDGNENGLIISVYFIDSDYSVYTYLDSRNYLPAGVPVVLEKSLLKDLEKSGEHHNITYSGSVESIISNYSYIYDSKGRAVAILSVSSLLGEVNHLVWQNTLDLFLSLSCILIAVYVIIKMAGIFRGDFRRMRSRKPEEQNEKRTDMCGLFAFLDSIIFSADSVILVYVAKSLCEGLPVEQQAIMVALPMSAFSVGALLGKIMFNTMSNVLGERKVAIASCMGLLIFSGVLVLSVQIGSIWIFSFGKFFMGAFLGGFVLNLAEILPLSSDKKEVQTEALHSSKQSNISASILSILIGGYLSSVLSYEAIYMMGAVVAVFLLILSIFLFKGKKKRNAEEKDDRKKTGFKTGWAVFLKGPILMYIIFFCIPAILNRGYASYLYPMYTSGAGISALLLSKIAVFSNTLTFGLNEPIKELTSRFDSRKMIIVPSLIACIGFVCFFLSPNVYWAVLMFFVMYISERMTGVSSRIYLVDYCEKNKIDKNAFQSNHQVLSSFLDIFRSPTLSCFVALGMNLACTALGVVSGILFSIFGAYLKKSNKDGA